MTIDESGIVRVREAALDREVARATVADAYLNVAERVLLTYRGGRCRPREIIESAYAERLLPWHLHGSTRKTERSTPG